MDILKNKFHKEESDKFKELFTKKEASSEDSEPQDPQLSEHYGTKTLVRWKAADFEPYEGDKKWQAYMWLALIAIIGYSIYANSLIPAMVFILICVVIYLRMGKEPEIIDFAITTEGVVVGKEIFEYDNIKSFWIFYDPPHEKYLSLHTSGHMLPFVHISVGDQNPVEIRHALMKYVPEIKQDPGLVDVLERIFRI